MELKKLFDSWAQSVEKDYIDQQWLLSKWEILEGVQWSSEKIQIMIDSITEGLNLKDTDRLVDLGCGGAWILKEMLAHAREVDGLDFSLEMLANATALCPKTNFINGQIGQLPIKDGSYDCALSYFVFLNFMDDEFVHEAIIDILRIVKTGGRVLIGQLPDITCREIYDQQKREYLEFCKSEYKITRNIQEECQAPQKLFDRDALISFLKEKNVSYSMRKSFNPFYRPGAEKYIDWRFDLVLEKT